MRTVTLTTIPHRTYVDYETVPEGTPAQLVDGDLILSPTPPISHALAVTQLAAVVMPFVRERGLGVVLAGPVTVRLSEDNALQPDLVFVSAERLDVLGEHRIDGPPDLVAEVLSPETAYYDLRKKRRLYEEAGVAEYWIVDPSERSVTVLVLDDEVFQTHDDAQGTGSVSSAILQGLELDLNDLFQIRVG